MKIVVVGAGRMGRLRARLLGETVGGDAVVLTGSDVARSKIAADELGVRSCSFEDGMRLDADGYVLCVETTRHEQLLSQLFTKGKPILCEKPLSDSWESSQALALVARGDAVSLQMGYHRRFDKGFLAARQAVQQGSLGKFLSISVTAFDHRLPTEEFLRSSGGVFRDLHVHDFDLIRWISGSEIVEMAGVGSPVADSMFSAVGDLAVTALVGTLENGGVFSIRGSRSDARGQDVRLEVFGSDDSVQSGLGRRSPLRSLDDVELFDRKPFDDFMERFSEAFANETKYFASIVAGDSPITCGPLEDLEAARLAEAAEVAVRQRRSIEIERIPF